MSLEKVLAQLNENGIAPSPTLDLLAESVLFDFSSGKLSLDDVLIIDQLVNGHSKVPVDNLSYSSRGAGKIVFNGVNPYGEQVCLLLYAPKEVKESQCERRGNLQQHEWHVHQRMGQFKALPKVYIPNERDEGLISLSIDSENLNLNYAVVQKVGDCTLREYIDRFAPVGESEALQFLSDILPVVEVLHEHGRVIHRDLQPTNIMVDLPPKGLHFYVIDLDASVSPEELTQEGEMTTNSGARSAVPPEIVTFDLDERGERHWRIKGRLPSPKEDIFALGCRLYELVTGEQPIVGDEVLTRDEVYARLHKYHTHRVPFWGAPFSRLFPGLEKRVMHWSKKLRRIKSFGAAISNPLETIIHKMVAREPARYDELTEISRDVEAYTSPRFRDRFGLRLRQGLAIPILLLATVSVGMSAKGFEEIFSIYGGPFRYLETERKIERNNEFLPFLTPWHVEDDISQDVSRYFEQDWKNLTISSTLPTYAIRYDLNIRGIYRSQMISAGYWLNKAITCPSDLLPSQHISVCYGYLSGVQTLLSLARASYNPLFDPTSDHVLEIKRLSLKIALFYEDYPSASQIMREIGITTTDYRSYKMLGDIFMTVPDFSQNSEQQYARAREEYLSALRRNPPEKEREKIEAILDVFPVMNGSLPNSEELESVRPLIENFNSVREAFQNQ